MSFEMVKSYFLSSRHNLLIYGMTENTVALCLGNLGEHLQGTGWLRQALKEKKVPSGSPSEGGGSLLSRQ